MTARRAEHGQATTEYLLVALALIAAFFLVPIDGRTLSQTTADMVRLLFRNLTYFLSLP